ncbi:MAG: helix-turn-helix transcriptional regulator [Rhodobacteraceae bacterium]|nr:helix-turn-helix transcriptional regulator [Paracoccaceae bacterium]
MRLPGGIALVLLVQALCTVFFVSDIVASVLGLRDVPIAWQTRELLEIGAALGLVLGLALGALALFEARREVRTTRMRLRRAQGAFQDLMDERFTEWGLTAAERDVALFAIKGLNTAEIAAVRGTSEGTIKSQSNAIYRKAGVGGRAQLLGLLIDDLTGTATPAPQAEAERRAG